MAVPKARNFLPRFKCTAYLPALLDPERATNNNLSKRRELLSQQNSVHILQDMNSPPVFAVYSLTRTQNVINACG